MITSTLGVMGSVRSRNFVPVGVWKHVRRKRLVSRVSMPVVGREGFGLVVEVVEAGEGTRGVRERVIAWTLEKMGN